MKRPQISQSQWLLRDETELSLSLVILFLLIQFWRTTLLQCHLVRVYFFFVFQDCIPTLVNILKSNQVTQSTIMLFTAVLQALTNLTTLNQSHQSILPFVNVLCELLDRCDVVQIKVWF